MTLPTSFRLVTLGRLALVSPDGTEDDALNKRRRKVAVLAVLAIERRPIPRDRLVEMFWGDQPEERARHSLSDALSHLRRLLGRDAITLSRSEIALSPSAALVVDAWELIDAADAGDHDAVIRSYAGPFLEAVFVPDSTTFEHWADRQRRRLADLVLRSCAARCAALARARRWDECAAVASRWLELEPASSDAILFRLNALKAPATPMADRRALAEFEHWRARLRAELDLAPDPSVVTLVESIRNRLDSAPPAPTATARSEHDVAAAAGAPPVLSAQPAPPASPAPVGSALARPRRLRRLAAAALIPLIAVAGFYAGARRAEPALSPDVLVVLPFVVHGDADARYLREGMADLLATNLDGAGRIRAVDPRATLSHLSQLDPPTGPGADSRLAPATARDVARRFGAGMVVLGDVTAVNGRLRITASLYDVPGRSAPRARGAVEGTSSDLFELVDQLTRQLLTGYRDPTPDGLTGLAARTSTSLPALKSYLEGVSAYRAGRFDDAVAAFRTAADEDSAFALAHYQLSNAMLWSARGSWESIVAESRAASRHGQRLTSRARLLVDGYEAFRSGRLDDAEQTYRRLVESYPDDVEGAYQYGDLLYHGNGLRGRPISQSRAAFERVLAIEPAHLGAMLHLLRIAIAEGRRADAEALIGRATRVAPPPTRVELTALRSFAYGDSASRDRAIDLLRGAPDEVVRVSAMRVALFVRDTRGATRIARLLLAPSRAPEFRAIGRLQLADLALAEGRREEALAQLDSARALAPAVALEHKALHLIQPFLSVPRAELAAMRDTLRRWDAVVAPSAFPIFAVHNELHRPIRLYLLGMLAVRLGDLAEAERQAAALESYGVKGEPGEFARGMGSALRGHVLAERGRLEDALAAFQRAELTVSEGLLDSPFGAQGRERFARAEVLRALGRHDEARAWLESLGYTALDLVIYAAPAAERIRTLRSADGAMAMSRQ